MIPTIIKKLVVIGIIMKVLVGCNAYQDRTDAEMLEIANEIYQDYLFEYRIDDSLFSQSTIVIREDGAKSYKWLAIGSENNPTGIEVVVSKKKNSKPEWILIGNKEAWLPLVNTK